MKTRSRAHRLQRPQTRRSLQERSRQCQLGASLVFTLTVAERHHQRAAADAGHPDQQDAESRCNVEAQSFQGQSFDSLDYIAMPAWASRSAGIRMFYVRAGIAGYLLHYADTAMV